MKSGKSYKRNLLLAAMMVSMCTTTLVAQADPSSIYEAVSDTGCGTYTLNIDDVTLTQSLGKPAGQNRALIINGNGLYLDGNNQFSGFETPGNYLILTNLTSMQNFYKTAESGNLYGGAIHNNTNLNFIPGSGEGTGPIEMAINFLNNRVVGHSGVYGGAIATTSTGAKTGNIVGDFINNSVQNDQNYKEANGGAIYNDVSVIDSISAATGEGDHGFISNTAQGGNARGGAIFNAKVINNINSDFVGNKAISINNYIAQGGAINNSGNSNYVIKKITGNFTNNEARGIDGINHTQQRGGAIYNDYGSIIGDYDSNNSSFSETPAIEGNFSGNKANRGGAIYNDTSAKIGNIIGNFLNNYSTSEGGAIHNTANGSKIGNITGNFTGNNISTDSNSTYGGAIYNENKAKIGNIIGDFSQNKIVKDYGTADGGAIYNFNNAKIGDITGSFSGNYIQINKSSGNSDGRFQHGGAIFNDSSSQIGAINGDFSGNYIETAETGFLGYTAGGAIFNRNNSTIDSITAKTTTGFTGNYVNAAPEEGASARMVTYGGAIANLASIGNINANFTNNYVNAYADDAFGGAVYNTGTLANITGDFNGNYAFAGYYNEDKAYGGAIYNTGTIGDITTNTNVGFTGNYAEYDNYGSLSESLGGAIYNTGTIGDITANFNQNEARRTNGQGGAIYNEGTLGSIIDSSFISNSARKNGGAIYNSNGALNIVAATKNVEFTGNKSNGNGSAIYNTSTEGVTLSANGGNIIFRNNNSQGTATGTGSNGIYTSSLSVSSNGDYYVSLNDTLYIGSSTNLNGGTLKLGSKALTNKFDFLNVNTNSTIDLSNNGSASDNMRIGKLSSDNKTLTLNVDYDGTVNYGDYGYMDKLTVDNTEGTPIIDLNNINITQDGEATKALFLEYNGSNITIANPTIAKEIASSGGYTYTFTHDGTTKGLLNISRIEHQYDLPKLIADSTLGINQYSITTNDYKPFQIEKEDAPGTYYTALGTLNGADRTFTISGGSATSMHSIDGTTMASAKGDGVTVGSGRTLNLRNISQFKNFTTAVDNAGILNVEGVTFTSNTTDVNNTATLNLSGTNIINTITDAETPVGTTNITGGNTVLWTDGSITQNTINLKGGNLLLNPNSTLTANIVADGSIDKTGYLNSSANINGTISGTFKGNNTAVALRNSGTIGVITADFVNNINIGYWGPGAIYNEGTIDSISGNFTGNSKTSEATYVEGGAIYNSGTITNGITNSTFTGNSATSSSDNAYGGAIYQNGGTMTISGSTFGGSEEGQGNSATSTASGKNGYGGAIYLTNATATITDSNFEKNSAMWGGAIYQNSGSITITDSTFKNNTGNVGGAIYQKAGTLSINGSTYDNSGNIWQESGTLSITDSNFTNTDVISRLGSNVTISGSTFDNSSVHFIGKGNETSAINQNTFSIVNSTIENIPDNYFNAYALSVVGGDVTIDGVNIINNTYAKAIKSESAAQGSGDNTHYSKINIIAQAADVNITGNKYGINVIGWGNDPSLHTTLSLYAKDHDILISNNSEYGIYYSDDYGVLTLNADTGHNITINDAVKSTTGMTINDNTSATHAGTVALNGNLANAGTISVGGGTLELGSTAVTSLANAIETNDGTVKLTGGTLTQAITGNTTIAGTVIDNNATLGDVTILGTANFTDNGGTFTTADNAGTFTINGVTLTANGTSIKNTNVLNLTGTNTIKTITDAVTPTGTTNITGGTTTIAANGSVTQDTINMQGGRLIINNGANIAANIVGNEDYAVTTTSSTIGSMWGGALQNHDGYYGNVKSISGTFKGNSLNSIYTGSGNVQVAGGAISTSGQLEQGINATFINNQATSITGQVFGGALYISDAATIPSVSGTFTNNKAISTNTFATGGAISANGNITSGITGTFTGNSAISEYSSAFAGAISDGSANTITNSTFTSNSVDAMANAKGGAVMTSGNIDGSTFTSNSAKGLYGLAQGGAVYVDVDGEQTITNTTFTGNTVTGTTTQGSAVFINGSYNSSTDTYSENSIIGSTFTENGAGGVLYVASGHTTVKNSNFTNNLGDAIVFADDNWSYGWIDEHLVKVYQSVKGDIIAEAANVAITGNSGWGIVGNKNHETDSALTLYAKSGNITINGNIAGGINNNGLALTLNADTHVVEEQTVPYTITINDAVSSTTGMTINAGGTHAGTVALNGALTLGDVISVGGGTLELGSTAVTSLNKAISTNSGTVKLTGGTLTQAIAGNTTVSGSDVTLGTNGSLVNATVANGAKLTSQASQFTTMNNLGTLLLSGTLDKAISGTGETKINQTLTFAEGENPAKASIAGTLNMNSGTLNMVEEETPAYTNYTVGTLKGSGNLAIDFDGTNTDKLTITTADETPITVTLTALNGFTKGQDAVSAKTILSGASNITLAISSALREAFDDTVITPDNYYIDPILSAASWTDEFKNRYYDISTGKQLTVDNSTDNKTLAYVYNVQNIYDPTKDVSQGDTLALVNQKIDTTRTFTTDSATAVYNVSSALGNTGVGKITVQGVKSGDDISTLNMAGNTGFVVGTGAEVELNTVKVTNTANSDGSLINNTAGTATLNNVEVAQNSANVINNANTLNLEGANTINAGITGTNGTTNVNSGSSIVNSITQKLINIFTGAKLASNGNVTTGTGDGEGIQNAVANGLELKGGTLTGNVAGAGSTKIAGTVSIADGSKISQGINIASGKLTTSATGIDGAVSNAVENGIEFTGGELTKAISGDGSTVINSTGIVTIGTGGSISQAVAIQSGTLKTGVNGFTQNITSNAGVVELTGTGTLTQTIAGNTTVSGTDIINNGSLANVTITDSGVLTSASDKISGNINNGGTLKLSGNLNKTISGGGETIANSNLTIGTSASVEGKLNANGNTLNMSGDSLATQTNVGTLKGAGTLSVDVINNSGTIVSDSIKATNYDSIAYEITNITGLDSVISGLDLTTTTGDSTGFNLTVLDGYTGSGLTVADSVISAYTGAKQIDRSHTEELTAIANWNKKFTEETWKDNYNQTWTSTDGKLAYTATKTGETAHSFADGDTLQMLNTTTNFGTDERKFITTDKNAIHNVSTDLGSTSAGTMTVQGATDGTNTSTINMANNTGFVVGVGATVNLDTVNITGTKTADGSLINNTAGEVNLNNVSVATNTNDVITNNSTMNLTGSNDINSGITGTGTTNVKSGTSIIDRIAQKVVEIFTGAKLQTESIAATNGVTNAGDLAITGDANTSNITGAGTTEFTNNVNNTGDISQGTVKVADGKTLTTTGDITTDNLTNGGTVTLNSADTSLTIKGGTTETPTTIAGTINGTGSTVIEGNAQNNGTIASAVEITTSGKLSTNASNVTGAVTNNATDGLTLTGGTIQNAINGTGSTVIAGTVSNSGDKSIDNAVTIASGSLTTDASQIKQAVTNNVNNGLDLTGGNLASNITGTGSTVISGNVTNNDGKSLGTDMTVSGSLATNADNIGGNITNTGNVQLTGGTLLKDITGGTTQIAGDVTNSANIGGTTNITSGSLDNSNGKIANATVGAGTSLTSNADNVSGTVNVTGDYNVTGGAIAGAVTGTGNTNINADTEVKAAVSSNINVADGKTLNVNPTSGNISSAVSVALGDGSKLDISGNTASGDTLNNISVASGKTANLAMDWGDSISTNNIAGNLNVSDIDLTGTTIATPTTYNMATGSNIANVAINENVNLKTNETSFNQVKYNSTTGSFIGAKNNLVQAVTTTEAGESAIYSMSGDEPAGSLGAGVLDGGKLIVQGNGNTISGYGIEVGDGTHNAILTIKDANMKDITGDALLVKGGNTATVMAENSDIEISGATGNAITLNKDANGNSTVNINGGSHTVTIENDIISDDSGNTINFNSGTINFNGKFDPAAAVVGGATVNRGGDDDGIDWTVTSGTLNYLQDSYLNRATNTMNLNGGTLNTVNGVVTDFALGGFKLSNDSNFYADVDLAAGKMDNFLSTPTTYTGGTLHVAGLNLISDATADNTSIPFANSTLAGHVDYTGAQGLTALSPIYKYNVGYNSSNGNFDFARYNSGGYDGLNPAIMAAPVAAQMGGYLTQLNSYDEAFRNMDMYMLMTAQQRQALKNKNKVASIDGGVLYDATLMRQERAEGWFRPFATFEKVGLRNGPKVENIAYGTYMGGESQMYDLGHGWDGIWGAYVGYNGSHQNYDGVSIYQNGGTLGVLGMAYKGNFFTGLTINAGASGVEASTMYGNEDFAMLMAGIASKTGYNWELFNGKFIIQPSMLMSYSFVNTFDYKNAAGVNVDSDPLHAIQLQPEIKFIGNLKNGWQPYASVAMVWNIMDDTKFKANDVSLPELSVKPYVKYGVGVRKTWGERLTGFFQTYLTNGGRNGVGLQAGFTWAFGGGKNKKADEQKIQKSLNKTPELKKTEIVLNGKKVQ